MTEFKEEENKIIIKNIYDGVKILTEQILEQVKEFEKEFQKKERKIIYMKSILDKIKNTKYNNCCICSSDISIYGITKCYHFYCFDCIIQLIKNNNNCAMCRTEITNINEIIFFSKNNLTDTSININSLNLSSNKVELATSTISTGIISNISSNNENNENNSYPVNTIVLNNFIDDTYDLIGLITLLFSTFSIEEKLKYSSQIHEINNKILNVFTNNGDNNNS